MQTYEMKNAHNRAPTEAGWYSVCMAADPDFHDRFPFCPPIVIYYDGTSDDIEYDPLTPCKGGIQGIESVAWWGSIVPDKPFPYVEK